MKNIIKLSFLVAALVTVLGTASCSKKEVDTDQMGGPISLAAVSPNPVVRGAELHLYGNNLDQVVEVRIPGVDPIKDIRKGTTNGRLSEIIITVPLEGPEVGKVVVADASGNESSTTFDLTYTEGMVFEDFSCNEVVMPGDVITLTGEYLYNIQEVIFTSGKEEVIVTGSAIFDKARHSAKVYVPAQATSGIIKICDTDEAADPTAIPNIYPSTKEITVGQPTVDVTEFEESIKAGTVLTFTGTYLNMIAKVEFSGVEQESFSVSEDATELYAALPAKAADGDVVFTTYAGDTFTAGTLIGVLPSGLSISPDEESDDPRYKAGYRVFITGEDLDLVSGVSFGGVDTSFTYDWESVPQAIISIIPETAPDGDVVVSLANGSRVVVDNIAWVNPTVDAVSTTSIVAREDFEFTGKDLELITKVSVGGIECKFTLDTLDVLDGFDEEGDPIKIAVLDSTKVIVTTDPTILSGDVVIEKMNGWSTVISQMEVSYDEPITLNMPASVALGKPFTASGSNLFKIEQIYIKGKKVVDWVSHSNTEISFQLPENMGPGVYRLDLVLNDGTVLTWAIPFEVTAPYTEAVMFEGEQDLGSWSINWEMKPNTFFVDHGAKEGDILRVYGRPTADWWQIQFFDGHWGGMDVGLGNGNNVNPNIYNLSEGYVSVELDAARAALLTTAIDWGYAFILQGENFIVTKVSLVQFGATETVVWEDTPVDLGNWSINWELKPASMFADAGLSAGMTLYVYVTQTADYWQIQFFDGHWNGMDMGMGNGNNINAEFYTIENDRIAIPVTADVAEKFTTITDWGYCGIIQGENLIVNKITIE